MSRPFRSAPTPLALALALVLAGAGTLATASPAHAWNSWDVGDLRLVSRTQAGVAARGPSMEQAISADGRFVVFTSVAELIPGADAGTNIFRRNLTTGELKLVSADATGQPADRSSSNPDISGDGRFVVFESKATNLTPLGPVEYGIFVKDMVTGEVEMVSVSSDGAPANAGTSGPTISPDGSRVTFQSAASNLTDDPDNGWSDIFLVNRTTDVIRVVSTDSGGGPANNDSEGAVVSNGPRVIFQSWASDLSAADTDTCIDLFVWSPDGGQRLLNLPCTGLAPPAYTISGDGRVVAFGRTVLSLASGSRWTPKAQGVVGGLSTTGRFATFETGASLVRKDTNRLIDIYVRDLQTDTWQLATQSSDGDIARTYDGPPYDSSLSGDGSFITFGSWDTDLVNGDDNDRRDVFVARLK